MLTYYIIIYGFSALFSIITLSSVWDDYKSFQLFKNSCYSLLNREWLNKKDRKMISTNIEYLFEILNSLDSKSFRRLKMSVRRECEDSFSSKMYSGLLSFVSIFIAIIAVIVSPEKFQDKMSQMGDFLNVVLISIGFYIICYSIRSLIEKHKAAFNRHFITAIEESELHIPLNTRPFEAQYQAQSTSADRQQSVSQYGSLESHEPTEQ